MFWQHMINHFLIFLLLGLNVVSESRLGRYDGEIGLVEFFLYRPTPKISDFMSKKTYPPQKKNKKNKKKGPFFWGLIFTTLNPRMTRAEKCSKKSKFQFCKIDPKNRCI